MSQMCCRGSTAGQWEQQGGKSPRGARSEECRHHRRLIWYFKRNLGGKLFEWAYNNTRQLQLRLLVIDVIMARTMQTARPRKSAAPKRRQGEEQNAGPQPHGEGGHDALCGSDEACASGDEDGQRVVLGEKPLLAVAASTSLSLAQHPAVTIQISNAAPTASLGVHEVVFSQPGASTATAASCGTSAATAAASSSWVSPEQLCLSLLKSANAVNLRFTVSSSDPTFLEKQDVQVCSARQQPLLASFDSMTSCRSDPTPCIAC